MKVKTKHGRHYRHRSFVLLLAFSIIVEIGANHSDSTMMMAFADHPKVDVSIAPGSNTPGCDNTNECYIPHKVSVNLDGEVTCTNDGTSATTITGGNPIDGPDGLFDSGLIDPGRSFSFKFKKAVEYSYFSMIHPWMAGVVIVQEASSEKEHGDKGDEHGEEEEGSHLMKEEGMDEKVIQTKKKWCTQKEMQLQPECYLMVQ